MKKTLLIYGGFSVLFMLLFFILKMVVFPHTDFDMQEILGWIGIFISTLFVYFGIKYYRDRHNGGSLSFGKGLKVGLLILLLPSIAFGLFSLIYIKMNPEFMDTYYQYKLSELQASLPAAEAAAQIQEVEKQKEFFMSPFVQFFSMFLSVFAVGLIIAVISSLILRRSREKAGAQRAFS